MKPKTLLYVAGIHPAGVGGFEVFVRALAEGLQNRGWRLAVCFEGDLPRHVNAYFREANVAVERLERQDRLSWKLMWSVFRLLVRYRPAVFFYAYYTVLRPYGWMCRLLGVRRVFYNDRSARHPAYPARRRAWHIHLAARLITLPLTGIICVSDHVRENAIRESFVSANKIHAIRNGVIVTRTVSQVAAGEEFRLKYGIPQGRLVVLQAGWMAPVKGFDVLLEAAKVVLKQNTSLHFVLVGTGPHLEEYRDLAQRLGIHGNVVFTGRINEPTENGVFAAADIYCQISRWEGLGVAVLEAMSFAKPVVAARTGGLRELVVEGESGFLVEAEDVNGLAVRLQQLAGDKRLRESMGEAGQRRVQREFDVTRTADRYLDVLGITREAAIRK